MFKEIKKSNFLAIFRDQGIKTPNFVSVTLLWFCDAFQRTGGALYRTGDASQMIGGSKDMDSVALQMTSLCRTPGKIWEEFSTQSMSRIFFDKNKKTACCFVWWYHWLCNVKKRLTYVVTFIMTFMTRKLLVVTTFMTFNWIYVKKQKGDIRLVFVFASRLCQFRSFSLQPF